MKAGGLGSWRLWCVLGSWFGRFVVTGDLSRLAPTSCLSDALYGHQKRRTRYLSIYGALIPLRGLNRLLMLF